MGFKVRIEDPKCKFSSSHFLRNHSKCSRLHGHNYKVMMELSGELNDDYFVVDFFILKTNLIAIADEFDHAILLPTQNPEIKIEQQNQQILVEMDGKQYQFPETDVRLLPIKATTAELFAKYIYDRLKPTYPNCNLQIEVAESDGAIAIFSD